MRKLILSLIFTFFIIILPLLFKSELLLNYKSIVILTGGLLMFLTQPAFSLEETKNNKKTDKYSILIIFLSSGLSVSSSLIEWAYFHNNVSNEFYSITGIFMIVLGLMLRIASIITLGNNFTATARATDQHKLVKSGPYSFIRHPSYTGAILVMTGVPVLLNNILTFFTTLAFLLSAYIFRIKNEEDVLLSIFGDSYKDYSLKVKKIIPYIW